LLKSALPSDSSTVTISYTTANAFFTFGNVRLICRLIDERFPDYEAVIPVSNPNIVTLQRLDFLNSLRRIQIYSNKSSNQIRLKVGADELTLSAEDTDFNNEATESVPGEYDGSPLEIGFTARFLIEMVNNVDGNMLDFELMAPNKPGLIIPKKVEEGEAILMLIMPVMLNNYL